MGVARTGHKGRQSWRNRVAGTAAEKAAEAGLRHGFRSGLEQLNAKHLEAHNQAVHFEVMVMKYIIPESFHKYHVDFCLPNGIIIETKGKFETNDRAKHLLLKNQFPEADLRFVFQRPHDPIYKGSKTTLAQWAEKFGFKWSTKLIPVAWMLEEGPPVKPWDLKLVEWKEGAPGPE